MKRLIKIAANIPFDPHPSNLSKIAYLVTKKFDDGSTEFEEYSLVEKLAIGNGDNLVTKGLIQNLILPAKDDLKKISRIEFNNCIFVNEVDLNFYEFDGIIIFKNCIFKNSFTILGSFYAYVSFEQSSFIKSKINFQECLFDNFNFKLVTLNSCDVNFKETEFRDENPMFNDVHLYNSTLRFMGTIFPTSAKIFNFLAVETDDSSVIQFRMVDFDFREFRLFRSKINTFIFSECTFNCNRFEWECDCETLILQKSRNFRIMDLGGLKGLKHLNIHGFLNTGKIILGNDINYYINALNSSNDIFWVRSNEYRSITILELKAQLFTLVDFFTANQSQQIEAIHYEIKVIEKEEEINSKQGLNMRIFLSYSWNDESLANNIEERFAAIGITLIRDKRDIKYRGSIKEFMKKIRFNDYVVLVISPNYLKSSNCMYEISELTKDEDYKTRILPVIKNDTGIFDPIGRNTYTAYWEDEYRKLYANSEKLDPLNRSASISELIRYERIMRDLPSFLQIISDMNIVQCTDCISDNEFSKMIEIVSKTTFSDLPI